LKRIVEDAGFFISRCSSADMLYAFCEAGNFTDKWIKPGTFGYWFSHKFESGLLKFLGAQSVTISIKLAPKMHCFFCGEFNATITSLKKYDIPVCEHCEITKRDLVKLYLKRREVFFSQPYLINPPILQRQKAQCCFCNSFYTTDSLFEDYGFDTSVCPKCLVKSDLNILLSNLHVKPIWRD
jgi:hypothetical protein